MLSRRFFLALLSILVVSCNTTGDSKGGGQTNGKPKEKRVIRAQVIYTNPSNFLLVKDFDTPRGEDKAETNFEGDGFGFVKQNCTGAGNSRNVCNLVMKFNFEPLVEHFDEVAVHFFENAAKDQPYKIISSANTKFRFGNPGVSSGDKNGCKPKVKVNVKDKFAAIMPISKSCNKLRVVLSGSEISQRIGKGEKNRLVDASTSSGRNIFYVIEGKLIEGAGVSCQKLGKPFVSHFRGRGYRGAKTCSTADPVLIVRKKGLGIER